MYLTGVDRSWFRTPFLRHHFNIRDQSDIEALRHAGIVMVTIDSEKGIEMEEEADVSAEPHPFGQESVSADLAQEETVESLEGLNGLDDPHQSAMQARVGIPEPAGDLPLSDDRSTSGDYPPPARSPLIYVRKRPPPSIHAKNFAHAKQRRIEWIRRADEIFEGTRATEFIAHEEVHRVVDEVIGNVIEQQAASFAVMSLRQPDPMLHEHSLTVCTLAVILGRVLNYPRETLQQLGVGALLHDIGLARLPRNLMKRPKTMEPAQQALYQTHAELGAATLGKSEHLDPLVIAMVRDHHECGVSSLTSEPKVETAQELTRLVTLVDQYDEFVTGQTGLTPLSSNQALTQIYQLYHKQAEWMPLVSSLIRTIGVYPLYSLVILRSGELGVVGAITPGKAHLPLLYICRDEYRNTCAPPIAVDLALEPTGRRSIKDICDPVKSGVDIETVLAQVSDE